MSYSFGNYICELREKKNLTQAELGAKLGVSNKAVSKWENGSAKPSSELMYPLALELGTTIEELYRIMSNSKAPKTKLRKVLDAIYSYPEIKMPVFVASAVVAFVLDAVIKISNGEESIPSMLVILFAALLFSFAFGGFFIISSKRPMASSRVLDVYEAFYTFIIILAVVWTFVMCFITGEFEGMNGLVFLFSFLATLTFVHKNRKI